MKWVGAIVLVLAGLDSSAVHGQDDASPDELQPPWELTRREPGEPAWAPLFRLREAELRYRDTQWWNGYAQMRAHVEAMVGNHEAALAAWDSGRGPHEGKVDLPTGLEPRHAIDYLSAVADTARVIMINERHHAASDRLLTLELLAPLWDRGFRYFAAEAFDPSDSQLNTRGFPAEASGSYVRDPVFGEIVREALQLGYTLVAYESIGGSEPDDEELTRQQRRDLGQSQNLARATVEVDPTAKVLVHAGYSHIVEEASERFHPMAVYFQDITGIDPVTVDQTRLSERSEPAYEHPAYRACVEAGLVRAIPTILLHEDGTPFAPADFAVDLQVLTPRTQYTEGRPDWMALGGRRVPVRFDLSAGEQSWCLVEARLAGRPDDAIPLDRCEVSESTSAQLLLPPDRPAVVQIYGRDGTLLRREPWADDNR